MGLMRFLVDGYVDICAACGHEMAKEIQANREFRAPSWSEKRKMKKEAKHAARRRKWYGDFHF